MKKKPGLTPEPCQTKTGIFNSINHTFSVAGRMEIGRLDLYKSHCLVFEFFAAASERYSAEVSSALPRSGLNIHLDPGLIY